MMQHTPVCLASAPLAARVQDLTARALKAWALRWGVAASCTVASEFAPDAANDVAILRERGVAAGVRLQWPATLEGALLDALYEAPQPAGGTRAADSLAVRSVRHVLADLQAVLAQAWHVAGWEIEKAAGVDRPGRWSAPLEVGFEVAGLRFHAHVPGVRFQVAAPSTGAAAVARSEGTAAFSSVPVRVEAVVGAAEVSLADIAGLQCGDVLLLDESINRPLRLQVAGVGSPLLDAALGRRGGMRAVQLVSTSHS